MESLLKEKWTENKRILLSYSGGIDSSVLFFMLLKLREERGSEIGVFHLDHNLRKESSSDYDFVQELCASHQIPFYGYKEDVSKVAEEKGESVEKTARDLRYRYLEEICEKEGYDLVLLGHHRQDRVETFFMNLFRGSGRKGLLSIPRKRGKYFRPLWDVPRKDIEAYAAEQQIPFVNDHTNDEEDYFRNKIRNSLLPLLEKEYSPQLEKRVIQLIDVLSTEQEVLEELIKKDFSLKDSVFSLKDLREKGESYIEVFVSFLLKERFPQGNVNYAQHRQLSSMIMHSQAGEREIHGVVFSVESGTFRVFPKKGTKEYYWEVNKGIHHPLGYTVHVDVGKPFFDRDTLSIAKDEIKGKLILRTRKPGDEFQPVGMKGRKKLQDFFTDEKVPRSLRDQILLLADDETIYWVIGYRKAQISLHSQGNYYRVRVYKET